MNLRAWQNWLGFIKPNRSHRRRSLNAFTVERLESRCLLAASPASGTTSPCIKLTNGSDLVIEDNGSNLTYSLGSGSAIPFGSSLASLSKLTITGSSSSNTITILLSDGNGLSSTFKVIVNGNGGDDGIDASGSDFPVSLNGGTGYDTLIGGTANDTLNGSSSDDALFGGAGDDDLNGGSGNDELSGDEGDDLCLGDVGNDYITGGADNDVVNGIAGNDEVYGDDGNDYVYGGAGSDYVDGGGDYDIVKGQGGLDTIAGSLEEAMQDWENFIILDDSEAYRGQTNPSGVKPPDVVDSGRDRNDYEN